MGVNWQYVKVMERQGLLRRGARVLDIGSSNLYAADADDLYRFIVQYNPAAAGDVTRQLARRLAAHSTYPHPPGTPMAFVGEVFEAAGMEYLSFDIAKGYKTEVLDFNREALPGRHKGAWDVVLNFGTTEHIFNQLNSFKILHDATALGGHLYHQVPAVGFLDHCYFVYTGRFFLDLAGFNEYRVVDFWFGEPGGSCKVFDSVEAQLAHFPILRDYMTRQNALGVGSELNGMEVPNVGINVIYQKVKDRPFLGAIETQTSVGEIPAEVREAYTGAGQAAPRKVSLSLSALLRPLKNLVRPAFAYCAGRLTARLAARVAHLEGELERLASRGQHLQHRVDRLARKDRAA